LPDPPATPAGISPQIEHRLFSDISINWRAKPLVSRQAVIDLIASTTTTTGLKVYAQLDKRQHPTKLEVTDDQLAAVNIIRHAFHGDWNYTINPSLTQS
jgi:Rhodopirellula transposase DDE domain